MKPKEHKTDESKDDLHLIFSRASNFITRIMRGGKC